MTQTEQELSNQVATVQHLEFAELIDEGLSGKKLHDTKNPLLSIETVVDVCVGRLKMSVGEFLAAKEHQIFVLDQPVNQEIDLLVQGKVVARGMLVAVGENFAVKLTTAPKKL